LEYLHNQDPPVLHRDIKPANIKLSSRGLIKLVDFGLVKFLAPDDSHTITVLQGRGTVAYTPLEQYGGDSGHTDVRSDIYSLGATLYHLLVNRPPANAKQRFLNPDSLILPRTINSRILPSTARAIMVALSMHPDERPGSVAEFRELLHASSLSVSFLPLVRSELEWQQAIHENRTLLTLTGVLFVLSVLVSVL